MVGGGGLFRGLDEGRNEGRGCWIGRFNWTLEVRGSRSSFVEFDKVG